MSGIRMFQRLALQAARPKVPEVHPLAVRAGGQRSIRAELHQVLLPRGGMAQHDGGGMRQRYLPNTGAAITVGNGHPPSIRAERDRLVGKRVEEERFATALSGEGVDQTIKAI